MFNAFFKFSRKKIRFSYTVPFYLFLVAFNCYGMNSSTQKTKRRRALYVQLPNSINQQQQMQMSSLSRTAPQSLVVNTNSVMQMPLVEHQDSLSDVIRSSDGEIQGEAPCPQCKWRRPKLRLGQNNANRASSLTSSTTTSGSNPVVASAPVAATHTTVTTTTNTMPHTDSHVVPVSLEANDDAVPSFQSIPSTNSTSTSSTVTSVSNPVEALASAPVATTYTTVATTANTMPHTDFHAVPVSLEVEVNDDVEAFFQPISSTTVTNLSVSNSVAASDHASACTTTNFIDELLSLLSPASHAYVNNSDSKELSVTRSTVVPVDDSLVSSLASCSMTPSMPKHVERSFSTNTVAPMQDLEMTCDLSNVPYTTGSVSSSSTTSTTAFASVSNTQFLCKLRSLNRSYADQLKKFGESIYTFGALTVGGISASEYMEKMFVLFQKYSNFLNDLFVTVGIPQHRILEQVLRINIMLNEFKQCPLTINSYIPYDQHQKFITKFSTLLNVQLSLYVQEFEEALDFYIESLTTFQRLFSPRVQVKVNNFFHEMNELNLQFAHDVDLNYCSALHLEKRGWIAFERYINRLAILFTSYALKNPTYLQMINNINTKHHNLKKAGWIEKREIVEKLGKDLALLNAITNKASYMQTFGSLLTAFFKNMDKTTNLEKSGSITQ